MAFLTEEFHLNQATKDYIFSLTPKFGFSGFGFVVFLRTYSRVKKDGSSESWGDVVIRVTEGVFSIRKDHFIKNKLAWNDDEWQDYARRFAEAMFTMRFLPPGRGLWAAGTDIVRLKGSGALNNCGAVSLVDLVKGATWTMDFLMMGCGIGFDTKWIGKGIVHPNKVTPLIYDSKNITKKDIQANVEQAVSLQQPKNSENVFEIPDSREGWVESLKILLNAYIKDEKGNIGKWKSFDYSKLRPKGTPLKTFGGTSSGPDPLIKLHQRVEAYLDTYCDYLKFKDNKQLILSQVNQIVFTNLMDRLRKIEYSYMSDKEFSELKDNVVKQARENPDKKLYNEVRLQVDIQNAIGACVVAGNIRRSSELALGNAGDEIFLNLKNYKINPERQSIAWMSNNTVRLASKEDFSLIPNIAERIKDNGEPGIYNQVNVERYGRVGHYHDPGEEFTRELEKDLATLCNPCITGDSLILTKEGWKEVRELVGKKFIAIVNGREYSSTDKGFWSNGKKQVKKLKLGNGISVNLTDNHRLTTTAEIRCLKN